MSGRVLAKTWLVFFVLLPGVASAGTGAGQALWTEAPRRQRHFPSSRAAQVAKAAMPAVVSISVRERGGNTPEDESDGSPGSFGSGFIIHPDGYILTSAHVIEGAAAITVSLNAQDDIRRQYKAELIGQDPATDCALLRIQTGRKLPVLRLGQSTDTDVADWVVVIGNPFGLSHSVTVGVVSYKGRSEIEPVGAGSFFDYLQTDAPINPGNSGGPILDLNGDVIAIANAVNVTGQGIGFGIPIEVAKSVLPQLRAHGTVRRSWMGISVQDLTPELAQIFALDTPGVLVSEVVEGSPAWRAGLQVGDLITRLDEGRVWQAHILRWKVATRGIGSRITVKAVRGLKTFTFHIPLTAVPGPTLARTDAIDDSAPAGRARGTPMRRPADLR